MPKKGNRNHNVLAAISISVQLLLVTGCGREAGAPRNQVADLVKKAASIPPDQIDPLPKISETTLDDAMLTYVRDPFTPIENSRPTGEVSKHGPSAPSLGVEIRGLRLVRTMQQNGNVFALVVTSGNDYYRVSVGDQLGGGWVVTAISKEELTITANGQQRRLKSAP